MPYGVSATAGNNRRLLASRYALQMLKVVDKHLLKTYIAPLVLTFLVVLFVFLMQFIWKYIDDLVGKELEWQIVLKLFVLTSFTFIPMSMPLAILLSGLITYGNLAEKNELTALKSAGIPLHRVLTPLFILAVGLSVVTFFVANNVVPVISLKSQTLLSDIRIQKPALSIEEGVFYNGIENYVIRIGEKEKDNQTIHDVLIYDHSQSTGLATITYARHGKMEMSSSKQFLLFTLEKGFLFDENVRFDPSVSVTALPVLRGTFEKQQIAFDLSSFQLQRSDEDFYRDHYEMLNVAQLGLYIDTMNQKIAVYQNEFGRKVMQSLRYVSSYCSDTLKNTPDTATAPEWETGSIQTKKIFTQAMQIARENVSMMSFNVLDIDSQEKNLWRYEIERHRKYVLAAACILLFFIGAPLGAIIQKGGLGVPMVSSIVVFVVFWVLLSTGEHAARVGSIPTWLGMWLSTLVLTPFAFILVYKASVGSKGVSFDMLKNRLFRLRWLKRWVKKNKLN
jgi:lipopolysaccharide export system permease protein